MTAIREAALRSGVPAERLHIGGRPAAAVELKQSVKRVSWNRDVSLLAVHRKSILLLSGLVGIALAFWFLRSLRLGLIVIGVSYYASLMGVALVPLTGNSMNMVLIVMPTLLMVLALSAAIHVANYWKHAALEDSRTAVSAGRQDGAAALHACEPDDRDRTAVADEQFAGTRPPLRHLFSGRLSGCAAAGAVRTADAAPDQFA